MLFKPNNTIFFRLNLTGKHLNNQVFNFSRSRQWKHNHFSKEWLLNTIGKQTKILLFRGFLFVTFHFIILFVFCFFLCTQLEVNNKTESFVPELRSRKCFSCFGIPMLSICALWTLWTFCEPVWMCLFHIFISGYVTDIPIVGSQKLKKKGTSTGTVCVGWKEK